MTTKNIQKSAAKPKRKSRSLALGTCSALWREDCEIFSRNADGTFSMDSSMMATPYRYSFRRLMDTGKFYVNKPNVAGETPRP